jgi:hypothetical protein
MPTPTAASKYVKRGSYEDDLASGRYPLSWTSLGEMEVWIRAEETEKTIELILKEVEPNRGKRDHQWTKKHIYVCARMGTGGKSKYILKRDQQRKIASKRTPCPCRLVAKTYPGTRIILGRYENEHSHPIGSSNLIYTRIPAAVLRKIEDDLRDGVRPEIVVRVLSFFYAFDI